jgi:hypothetical protein
LAFAYDQHDMTNVLLTVLYPRGILQDGRVRRLPEHQLYSHALFAGAQFGHGPMVSGVQVSGDLDWVCGSNGVFGQITPCLTGPAGEVPW